MVGYSDSAKDAGRFAAAWSLYRAQEEVVAACAPARCPADAVPRPWRHRRSRRRPDASGDSIATARVRRRPAAGDRARRDDSGEVRLLDIAVRTMEVYTTATLEATLAPTTDPTPEWRAVMDRLSERARRSYRGVVYEDPGFVDYFHTATPEPELRAVRIGSRPPSRRRRTGGREPACDPVAVCLDADAAAAAVVARRRGALADASRAREDPLLRTMYERWPFFQSTVD